MRPLRKRANLAGYTRKAKAEPWTELGARAFGWHNGPGSDQVSADLSRKPFARIRAQRRVLHVRNGGMQAKHSNGFPETTRARPAGT